MLSFIWRHITRHTRAQKFTINTWSSTHWSRILCLLPTEKGEDYESCFLCRYKWQILQVDQKPSLYIVAVKRTAYFPQTKTLKHTMYKYNTCLRSLGSSVCAASRSNMYCKGGWRGWVSSSRANRPMVRSCPGNPASHITCWLRSERTSDFSTSEAYIWRVKDIWKRKIDSVCLSIKLSHLYAAGYESYVTCILLLKVLPH